VTCFNHPQQQAIGICKHCNRGLCQECATDLEHGLACKGRHEENVNEINMIVTKNAKILTSNKSRNYINLYYYLILGFLFMFFGYNDKNGLLNFAFVMGVGFIVMGLVIFVYNYFTFIREENRKNV